MNKSFLAAVILGCTLTACSSQPSDFRPNAKVSLDEVAPGSRDTDIYNMSGENNNAEHGHGAAHGSEAHSRPDVMLNHDEHQSDVDSKEVPAEEKTTDASKVENHE